AHAERFQARRRSSFQSQRRLGLRRLPGPGSRAEQDPVLYMGHQGSEEYRYLDADPDGHGNPPAHGADGFPAGSATLLPARPGRMAAVPCKSGAGPGADGLRSSAVFKAKLIFTGDPVDLEHMDSADPPLAVDRFYGDSHR